MGVDLNHYTEQHKKAFYEAVELAARVQDFIDYDGPDRTAYAERYALGLGVSLPTLYRYVDNILKANAWALKMEKEDAIPLSQPGIRFCSQDRHPHTSLGNQQQNTIPGERCQVRFQKGRKEQAAEQMLRSLPQLIGFYRPRHSSGRRRLRSCSAASMVRSMASLS